MWPQKWNPSASPGSTSAPTAPAPATSVSVFETRARKPRREVEVARPSAIAARSGMRLHEPSLGRGEDALELSVRVERPLRANRPVPVERDGERAARDPQLAPNVGVAHLVEHLDRDERIARERRHDRLQALAQAAAVGREDGERERRTDILAEPLPEIHVRAERRPLVAPLERRFGGEPQAQ